MTHVASAPGEVQGVALTGKTSFVEWLAVFAGAVLAAALSFVLLTFGASIGLSLTSPWPSSSGMSAKTVAAIAVFFAMIQQIGAFLTGGYIAGRMRARWSESSEDEVEFRDGLHGGLVWAVGVAFGAALLMMTAGAAARTGVDVAGKGISALSISSTNPVDAVIDTMMRPTVVAQAAAPAGQPPAAAAPRARASAVAPASGDDQRAEISRLLVAAVASGSITPQDRAYLAQLVSQRTGIPPQEAEQRVDAAITAAREAIDKARRGTILAGLTTAIALVVSFAAAWWAAMKGGQHRDKSVPARFSFTATRLRNPVPR
jgi:hypothetical protein